MGIGSDFDATGWLVEGESENYQYIIRLSTQLRNIDIEHVLVFDQLPPTKKVAMQDCKDPAAYIEKRYVKNVIKAALDKENISYFLAPHESDSQLQHLMHTNCIYAVLSKDSDMIFRRISRVIYEWNPNPLPNAVGDCYYFKLTSLERDLERENISFSSFQQGCLLLGTDYNPPIQKLDSNGDHFNFKYEDVLTLVKNHRNLYDVVKYEPTLRFEPIEVVSLDSTNDEQIRKRRKINATKFSGHILQVLRIATISAFCQSIYDEKEGNVQSVNYARPMLRGITEGGCAKWADFLYLLLIIRY
ncbi:Rad2 nuclease [Ranunculus cassubicifolius]